MVTRVFLDEKSVEAAAVPSKGESWIADTKIKGFGLRLYNSRSGPTKRFCIRTVDKNGQSIRKTFDEWMVRHEHNHRWRWRYAFDDTPPLFDWHVPLGRYAPQAREWAANEIRLLKGLSTVESQNKDRKHHFSKILKDVTFERCMKAVLSNYCRMKMSTNYVDKLDFLLAKLVPLDLRNKQMKEITEADALDIHTAINSSSGNRQTMMPFIGRVFDIYQKLAGGRNEFAIAKDILRRRPFMRSTKFEVNESNTLKIKNVISLLGSDEKYWQQGLCLQLYFRTRAPLSHLMAAQWDQLFEVTFQRSGVRRLEWKYGDNRLAYERFSEEEESLIWRIRERAEAEFGESPFWFPSRSGRKVGHIRSVDKIWTNTLNMAELGFITPRNMRVAIQEFGSWRIFS